ncbi:MAG TPA: hydroxymethylbilane synthase [Syntrophorhabdales bacterium]|nr:hydroxymethylbilane synthase [Syntrophorhabdales bacterium]
MKKKWILGTRGSKLALRQTEIVIGRLSERYPGYEFSAKIIKTTGDTIWDKPLHLIGGKGLFVKEIEEALLAGAVDMAVHSVKDMPVELPQGLILGAVLERENPRDAFISVRHERFADIKPGAKIGTGSLRRKAQILHLNRAIEVLPLRGNVDTRLRKLRGQNLDAIILACAGVTRMGFAAHIKEILPFDMMVPPSGQGAIGIETRDEPELLDLLQPLNHEQTMFEVSVERKLQALIGGGCSVPLGINASLSSGRLIIHSAFGTEEGELLVKQRFEGSADEVDALVTASLKPIKAAQEKMGHGAWVKGQG